MKNLFYLLLVSALIGSFQKKAEAQNVPAFKTELTDVEKQGGKLTPEIMWKFGRLSEVKISPDGKFVTYSVQGMIYQQIKAKPIFSLYLLRGGKPKNWLAE
jgi:hypothetical protein